MHYLIYLPNDEQSSDELGTRLAKAGLADHAANATPMFVQSGPDNKQGVLVGWLDIAAAVTCLEYRQDEQTWLKSPDGAYWVGIWNDNPPKESELRRPYTQAVGELLPFGAEQTKWKLPTPGTVDRVAARNDDGSWRWVPVREFAWIGDESHRMREEHLQQSTAKLAQFEIDPEEWAEWLLKLLRVNYHLTPEVAAHLELFRSTQVADAVLKSLSLKRAGVDDD